MNQLNLKTLSVMLMLSSIGAYAAPANGDSESYAQHMPDKLSDCHNFRLLNRFNEGLVRLSSAERIC